MNLKSRIEVLEKTKVPDEAVAALKTKILQLDPDADTSSCVDIASALETLARYLPN